MNKQPKLSVILLNYNGWDWLDQCLRSFSNLVCWDGKRPQGLEVIVIDNHSHENRLADLAKKYNWVTTKRLASNKGFAAGNNEGLKIATAEFVMLLNSDTEFLPHTNLLSLLDNFQCSPIAVVTPKLILDSGNIDHACHRGFPTPWNALMYFSGVAKIFPNWKLVAGYQRSWQDLTKPHAIEVCSGAAMIVRRKAINKVGLLDEDYFMYAEDIDWCYRFVQAGYQVYYDPQVEIIHHKHKSGLAKKDWQIRKKTISAFFDTMQLFMKKNYQKKYSRLVLEASFVMIELLKKWKLFSERKQNE